MKNCEPDSMNWQPVIRKPIFESCRKEGPFEGCVLRVVSCTLRAKKSIEQRAIDLSWRLKAESSKDTGCSMSRRKEQKAMDIVRKV